MNRRIGSRISVKAAQFTESVIREMTRQALRHNAINLAQGFPDFPAPEELKRAAQQAIEYDINQYAITWGSRELRKAIAAKTARWQGLTVDPETEITVCCGATEAMIATLLATINPGDEVIVFEPFTRIMEPTPFSLEPRHAMFRCAHPPHLTANGPSIRLSCARLSTSVPAPSFSIHRTILLARFSPAPNWNPFATSA
jgi:hypothetical protein